MTPALSPRWVHRTLTVLPAGSAIRSNVAISRRTVSRRTGTSRTGTSGAILREFRPRTQRPRTLDLVQANQAGLRLLDPAGRGPIATPVNDHSKLTPW